MPHSFRDFPAHVRALFVRAQPYRIVFGTSEGQRVLQDLFKFCGMDRDVFVPGAPDQTAYQAGMRRVALRIAGMLKIDEREAMRIAQQQPRDEGEFS